MTGPSVRDESSQELTTDLRDNCSRTTCLSTGERRTSAPPPPPQQGSMKFAFLLLCDLLLSPVVDMSLHCDHEGRAAKRRRDRRLRIHWRHEQLTLQMALAAALHHSRDVGPVTHNWFCHPRGTLHVLEVDHSGTAHTGFLGVRALPCGLDYVDGIARFVFDCGM